MLGALGVDVEERRYFDELPTEDEIRGLAAMLPGGVHDLVSTRGRRYREMKLADASLSDEEWVHLLAQEPGLWRRPVAVKGTEVVVGFNEAALRELVE